MRCSCPAVGAFDCSPRPFFATAKLAIFLEICKLIIRSKHVITRYSTLFDVILKYLRFSLVISPIFTIFVPSN